VSLLSFFNLGGRWGGWSTPLLGRLIPGNDAVPVVRRVGGPQSRSGRLRRIPPIKMRSPDRPARSEFYTDRTIPAYLPDSLFNYHKIHAVQKVFQE
jgi:hypothetical protein